MSVEEHLLDALNNDEDEEWGVPMASRRRERRQQRLQRKNRTTIDEFLGSASGTDAAGILPRYYGELLTWALYRQRGKFLPRESGPLM